MNQSELENLFKRKYAVNKRTEEIFESDAAGRAIYPASELERETYAVYLQLRQTLTEMKKEELCDFKIDNAAEHYEVHFIHIYWNDEVDIKVERILEILEPLSTLDDDENHYVMFCDEREWIMNFYLYKP